LTDPADVVVDAAGDLYIADSIQQRIRRVDTTGIITTVVGAIDPGQMGPASQAQLADPLAVVATPTVTLFAGGASGTVQALAGSALSTIAGRYPQDFSIGALARFQNTSFGVVSGVAYDPDRNVVYATESSAGVAGVGSNALDDGNQILAITLDADPDKSTIAQFANPSGVAGFGDGAVGAALFRGPTGLYLDGSAGVLYVADTGNDVIRAIDVSAGSATTYAGTPRTFGFAGDGSAATAALLFAPQAITKCGDGDVFIADTGNNRVRRIAAATGTISTVLGDGSVSSSGQGSPASSFPVEAPLGLACDATGNLFVTSTATVRMLPADASGVVDGSGPVRTIYGLPPRTSYPAAVTRCLTGLAVIDTTAVQVTDSCTGLLVELDRMVAP
jgi:sugar lactone lactonase YvrE